MCGALVQGPARIKRVRVVFVTTVLPGGRRTGGEVVSDNIIAALREAGHEVLVLGYLRPGHTSQAGEECSGWRPIETSAAGVRGPAWMARAVMGRSPYSSTKYRSQSYNRALNCALDEGADLVVIDHAQMHFALDRLDGAIPPVVFIAHNAEAALYKDLAAAATGRTGRWMYAREARLLDRIETRLAGRARQLWTLTEADAAYFLELCPAADVRTLEVPSSFLGSGRRTALAYDVAVLGSWSWKANRAGLAWFVEEVVPLLPDELTIAVAGAGSEQLGFRHRPITGHGVVADAQEFLSRARVVAVPCVAAGGMQVKMLDAIATGRSVVATSRAARGLADLPATVAIADQPAAFAREIGRLVAGDKQEPPTRQATDWSRARSAQHKADVARWADELARDGAGLEPALVGTKRSRTRRG
jgi:hypothetical protein